MLIYKAAKTITKRAAVAVAVGVFASGLASVARAEEVKILDAAGNTRSVFNLVNGGVATVRVHIQRSDGKPIEGSTLSLIREGEMTVLQASSADAAGMASFGNVPEGTFQLKTDGQEIAITDVEITKSSEQHSKSTESDEVNGLGQSVYIAGASAAGIAAVAIGVSGSGSSSGVSRTSAAFLDGASASEVGAGVKTSGGEIAAQGVGIDTSISPAPIPQIYPDIPEISSIPSPEPGNPFSPPPAQIITPTPPPSSIPEPTPAPTPSAS